MDIRERVIIASGASANGNYPSDDGVELAGGRYKIITDGNYEGATFTPKSGVTAARAVQLADANGVIAFTEGDSSLIFTAAKGEVFIAALSGAGSPSPDINMELWPVAADGVLYR